MILLDSQLPPDSGYQAAVLIREYFNDKPTKRQPLIVCMSEGSYYEQAEEPGVIDEVQQKPIFRQ